MMLHQAPNQEPRIDVPTSKEVAVGQKTHTIDMLELARRSDLRSSQIRVAGEEEKELEERVRGIRLKINQKMKFQERKKVVEPQDKPLEPKKIQTGKINEI